MKIKIQWDTANGELDTKTMQLVCVEARKKIFNEEVDAELAVKDGMLFVIAEIHTGVRESSNALCKEIVRRFNEFPESLKK